MALESTVDVDLSGLRPDQVRALLVQSDALIAGLSKVSKECRALIENDMDGEGHAIVNIHGLHVADITLRKAGVGKFRCVDEQAYAQWLIDHGKEDYVETITVPCAAAKADSFIRDLYEKPIVDETTGEELKPEFSFPAGCEQARGTAGGVSVKYAKDVYEPLLKTLQPAQVMGLLTGAPEKDADDEEPLW